MLIYLFKSMVCLSLLFGLYKLALGRTTFFRANHLALLFCTLLSVVAPFVQISVGQEVPAVGYVDDMMLFAGYVSVTEGVEENVPILTWQNILTLIYLMGVVWCVGNILLSAIRNVLFIRKMPAFRREKDYTLLLTDNESIAPYSLGRYVVISRADFDQNGEAILAHELCHVRRRHTLSVMLMNLLSAVLWINPIVWLVREELLLVCEYEADTAVIRKGIDAKQYQLLLIKKAVSPSRYTIANSLNHSSLKKRITMMRKSKSNAWARLNYCSLALATAVVLPAFAHKDIISPIEETLKENLVDAISQTAVVENLKSVVENLESEIGDKGTEISITEQIEAEEICEIAPEDTIKQSSATEVRISSDNKKPLVLLDGKEVKIEDVDMYDIASISVLKNDDAVKLYGEKGNDGVILIESKKDSDSEAVGLKKSSDIEVVGYGTLKKGVDSVSQMPSFEGGPQAMMEFIVKNMKYPEKAVKEQKEGRVIVQFIVSKMGTVEDVRVVRGISEELDAEAVRVVKTTSGHWKPGKNENGETVNSKFTLPVNFKLTGKTATGVSKQ